MSENKPKPIPQFPPDDIARFHNSYQKGSPDECWPWHGTQFKNGYGRFYYFYHTYKAHRIAYVISKGDPGELCVLHSCDNPPCAIHRICFLALMPITWQTKLKKEDTTAGAAHISMPKEASTVRPSSRRLR